MYLNNIIITNSRGYFGNVSASITMWGSVNVNLTIINNVIENHYYNTLECYAIYANGTINTLVNNVINNGSVAGINNYSNNILGNEQLPLINDNIYALMSDVFVDYYNGNYHLKPGSPGFGNGLDGTDIGIYGGPEPYVDNGYPAIPCIYHLDVPLTGNQQDGVNVTIKAKSNQ